MVSLLNEESAREELLKKSQQEEDKNLSEGNLDIDDPVEKDDLNEKESETSIVENENNSFINIYFIKLFFFLC